MDSIDNSCGDSQSIDSCPDNQYQVSEAPYIADVVSNNARMDANECQGEDTSGTTICRKNDDEVGNLRMDLTENEGCLTESTGGDGSIEVFDLTEDSLGLSQAHMQIIMDEMDEPNDQRIYARAETYFPQAFTPSQMQKQVMQSIIGSYLDPSKTSLLLQAPPGTGKSLAAFTALYGLKAEGNFDGPIIIVVKTHMQMKAWAQQLKQLSKDISVVCLGPRSKMCTNDVVKSMGGDINQNCMRVCRRGGCKKTHTISGCEGKVMDIEDLVQQSNLQDACAYFSAKHQSKKKTCHVIISVYHHFVRNTLEVAFSDSVVLVDEGHNLPSACKDDMSVEVKLNILTKAIQATRSKQLTRMKRCFSSLHEWDLSRESKSDRHVVAWKGFLLDNGFDISTLCNELEDAQHYLERGSTTMYTTQCLELIRSLRYLLGAPAEVMDCMYIGKKVYTRTFGKRIVKFHVIIIKLATAAPVIRHRVKSASFTVFMSGTLPSQGDTLHVFGLKKNQTAFEKSKLDQSRQALTIVAEGLLGTYENTQKPAYFRAMARGILTTLKSLATGGALVNVPSRRYMNKMKQVWKENGTLNELNAWGKVVFEDGNNTAFNDFENSATNSKAVFFMIARGRYAEGINIQDYCAKIIIICSVPFRPLWTVDSAFERIHDKMSGANNLQSWKRSYIFNAVSTVAQVIGRAIRWAGKAAIVLLDERYKTQRLLPSYIGKPKYTRINTISHFANEISQFLSQSNGGCLTNENSITVSQTPSTPNISPRKKNTVVAQFQKSGRLRKLFYMPRLVNSSAIPRPSVAFHDLHHSLVTQKSSNSTEYPSNNMNTVLTSTCELSQTTKPIEQITSSTSATAHGRTRLRQWPS